MAQGRAVGLRYMLYRWAYQLLQGKRQPDAADQWAELFYFGRAKREFDQTFSQFGRILWPCSEEAL